MGILVQFSRKIMIWQTIYIIPLYVGSVTGVPETLKKKEKRFGANMQIRQAELDPFILIY